MSNYNPHIYDALSEAKTVLTNVCNHKIYLPESSSRKSYDDYEEITIEKSEKVSLIPDDKLIKVSDNFDAVGRVAFANCTHLNQMQSIVYESAYKSNKNLLIAAPTGAGKTNVAMMTVLHELKNYFKPNSTELISKNVSEKFKIIYIAPMKSLATEQTENFNSRLKSLGIKARELTGDMSMTEHEISQTHIIVTTPEKWDIVTRKSKGDMELLSLVRLFIIDEVHLLQSERGPVLEALVARTLRYVESSQRMTRIIGLSATLPNYVDIAMFLRVNPSDGLFYFDNRFRPVPLVQKFIGVRTHESKLQSKIMDKICYDQILHFANLEKQVMIFVHTRNSTKNVAMKLKEMIHLNGKIELFEPDIAKSQEANRLMANPRNKLLKDLFAVGFGVHHAGMIRQDRLLVEKLFRMGALKVLVCTSTLAWGVNFPAHAVVIRGTEIYDSSAGKFVDVGLLDVMQIFGRAGRPQYDTDGQALIITGLNKMDHYLKLLTNQTPIESNFIKFLTDNLNAEIVSGTVATVPEAMEWLRYTYLSIRIAQNPLAYGFEQADIDCDSTLVTIRKMLIKACAKQLDEAQMCYYEPNTGSLEPTELGRIASHFYINYETVTRYNEILEDNLEFTQILSLIGEAQEFQQIKFREEEANDLDNLRRLCHLPLSKDDVETTKGKVNCLIQAYISRARITAHSLVSDLTYIGQNAVRIGRGLFEYAIKRSWSATALTLLRVCKMLEQQQWYFQTPLRNFDLPDEVIYRLEDTDTSIELISEMTAASIAKVINFPEKMAQTVKNYVNHLPYVLVDGKIKPINDNLLVMDLSIQPCFKWNERYHGQTAQSFWLWVHDQEITEQIHYNELIRFSKEQVQQESKITLHIYLPLVDNTLEDGALGQKIPNCYNVFVASNDWNGCDYEFPIECLSVFLPTDKPTYTYVPQNLEKLPLNVLKNEMFNLFIQSSNLLLDENANLEHSEIINSTAQIQTLNTIQSQVFFPIYHTDKNLLICAPAGSGKTLLAYIAMFRVFNKHGKGKKRKIVYLNSNDITCSAMYRASQQRFNSLFNKVTVIFKGNASDYKYFKSADVIISNSRNFYTWLVNHNNISEDLQSVSLFIFDDMHLMGDAVGSFLELIITELKLLASNNSRLVSRFIGLSNTCANHQDLAQWLDVKKSAHAYNFNQVLSRPVQLITHVTGLTERFYNPRMAAMNKIILKAIYNHSLDQPVMIFVSSKKQCNLTASGLISLRLNCFQGREHSWLKVDHQVLSSLLSTIDDESLRLSLEFGVGILHPGLNVEDKKIVTELYYFNKIQILICTQNYSLESSLRAHLVVIKGTERYDSNTNRLENYTPNEVMQMMGKAGRFNIDTNGVALLLVTDVLEEFYLKFIHEPITIESNIIDLDNKILKRFLVTPEILNNANGECQKFIENKDQRDNTIPNTNNNTSGKRGNKRNNKKQPTVEDPVILVKKRHIKKAAFQRLSSTFLVHRLAKNPSYYQMNVSDISDKFLDDFLDSFQSLYVDDFAPKQCSALKH